jgi:hypothetical protein
MGTDVDRHRDEAPPQSTASIAKAGMPGWSNLVK